MWRERAEAGAGGRESLPNGDSTARGKSDRGKSPEYEGSPDHKENLSWSRTGQFELRRRLRGARRPLTLPREKDTCSQSIVEYTGISKWANRPLDATSHSELPRLERQQRQSHEEGQHEAHSGSTAA